jgi:hypothetical protein
MSPKWALAEAPLRGHGHALRSSEQSANLAHVISDDKRTEDRVTINKEFESFDAFIQEYVTNISRTGVFIRSTTPLAIGTRVNLHFTVIMDDIETIEGIGEVVRSEKDGMGVVFREISQTSRDLIDKLLTKRD